MPRPAMLVAMVTAPGASGLRDDRGLTLVELGVEHVVLDAALGEQAAQPLGVLDRDGADEHRSPDLVALLDLDGRRVELRVDRAVDQVVAVVADHVAVGGDDHDRELVDVAELGVLGQGGTGHARELLVEAEVVLQRDGRERLVLLADVHALLGLDRLVQALRVAAADHHAAGELVDDHDLAVFDHVVDVALEQELGLERLLQVVDQLARRVGVDVVDAEKAFSSLRSPSSVAAMVRLDSSSSKSSSGRRRGTTLANCL